MELSANPQQIPPHLRENEQRFRGLFALLVANYLRLAEAGTVAGAELTYRLAVRKAQWLSPELLDATVEWVIEHVDGPLPTVAQFLAHCRFVDARRTAAAEQAAQGQRARLPAPAKGEQAAREWWDDQVARARLAERKRAQAIAAWRQAERKGNPAFPRHGPVPREVADRAERFTDAELAAMRHELAAARESRHGRRGPAVLRAVAEVVDAMTDDGRLTETDRRDGSGGPEVRN